jgi:hypothetical protein
MYAMKSWWRAYAFSFYSEKGMKGAKGMLPQMM